MTRLDVEDRPSPSDLGEPVPIPHGSERACHEGDCTRCEIDQAADEAAQARAS